MFIHGSDNVPSESLIIPLLEFKFYDLVRPIYRQLRGMFLQLRILYKDVSFELVAFLWQGDIYTHGKIYSRLRILNIINKINQPFLLAAAEFCLAVRKYEINEICFGIRINKLFRI